MYVVRALISATELYRLRGLGFIVVVRDEEQLKTGIIDHAELVSISRPRESNGGYKK